MPLFAFGDNSFRQTDPSSDDLSITAPCDLTALHGYIDVAFVSWSQTVFIDKEGRRRLEGLRDDSLSDDILHDARSLTGQDAITAYIDVNSAIVRPGEGEIGEAGPARLVAVNGHGHVLVLLTAKAATTQAPAMKEKLVWLSSLRSTESTLLEDTPDDIVRLYAGSSFFLVQCRSQIYSLGSDNRFGQLGVTTSARGSVAAPTLHEIELLSGMTLSSVAVGDLHCAAVDAETKALYVWGSDGKGQCGGHGGSEPALVTFPGHDEEEEQPDVYAVACGAQHTVVTTSMGVFVTGANYHGQLGLNDIVPRSVFTRLAGLNITPETRLTCGRYNTFIFTT